VRPCTGAIQALTFSLYLVELQCVTSVQVVDRVHHCEALYRGHPGTHLLLVHTQGKWISNKQHN
jgi:hypothetical protein